VGIIADLANNPATPARSQTRQHASVDLSR
jgi:hypothetical protein